MCDEKFGVEKLRPAKVLWKAKEIALSITTMTC